jgi:hypothetical protein
MRLSNEAALARIKDRCHVDDNGCWIWRGATTASNGGTTVRPRVWGADYSADPTGATMSVQTGNRAAWHAHTGLPIPKGHLVYRAPCCASSLCLNPEHLQCGTNAAWGKSLAAKGTLRGVNARIQANRRIGRMRSHITAEMMLEICASPETGEALAARLGIGPSIVSRARRGQMASMRVGNPFAGLMPSPPTLSKTRGATT